MNFLRVLRFEPVIQTISVPLVLPVGSSPGEYRIVVRAN